MKTKGLIVIGLDGASWDLINPWVERGVLPTFKKLKQKGAWGSHKSCLPPVTFPNWKCYSTGKNPGKLGVYWFEGVNFPQKRIEIPNSNSFKSKEIWDFMSEQGLKTAIINMPSTYPPKEVNGFLVAGGPDAVEKDYTYPKFLQAEIEDELQYRLHPRKLPINKDDLNSESINEIYDLIEQRFKLAFRLMDDEEIDFLHLTIFYINVLQHFFGHKEPVKRGWKLLDQLIGEFINDNHNLLIISDHGTGKINTVFWINTWLEKEGYLQTKSNLSSKFFKLIGSNRDTILKVSRMVGMEELLRRVTPEGLRNRIQPQGTLQKQAKSQLIAWDESMAIASGQGPIYLNKSDGKKYEKVKSELKNKLEKLTSPFSEERIAIKVHQREDIYSGPCHNAPDLVMEQSDGVHINGGLGRDKTFEEPKKWLDENYRQGLFLFHSPTSRNDVEIKNAEITDFAPTILHLMNIPIPDDMDGKVLKNIFDKNSEPKRRKIRYQKGSGEQVEKADDEKKNEEVRKRLEDLGYLS